MISVSEAKQLVKQHTTPLLPKKVDLQSASGRVLASDIYAWQDIPSFQQSSMDGYAFIFDDVSGKLEIIGEMQAGTATQLSISKGQATRIFTGAPLPNGADTVVMQEKVSVENGLLTIQDEKLRQGANVRSKGAEVMNGSLAMSKGTKLTPAALGFLAGIGCEDVEVYPSPSVAIIVTGKELQKPGKPLSFGQVYEANSYSLKAVLAQLGVENIQLRQADDDLEELTQILSEALATNDLVLLTGGVSVGDYDFVVEAARRCGLQQVFHKVKQKPGKPLYFGKTEKNIVFGLPGNPSSVLNCFYNYVLPAIGMLTNTNKSMKVVRGALTADVSTPAGLTQFLKGNYSDGLAQPLNAQESFQLSSFAQANCLICLEEGRDSYQKGESVDVYLLPDYYN